MILPILQFPDERLYQKSELVVDLDEAKEIVDNLIDTLKDSTGVGISAIQCGIAKKIMIISPDRENFRVCINPTIKLKGNKVKYSEGCLSSVGKSVIVSRYSECELTYLDLEGSVHVLNTSGFEAQIIEHEFCHLLGRDPLKVNLTNKYDLV